jgi:hypothetical protein
MCFIWVCVCCDMVSTYGCRWLVCNFWSVYLCPLLQWWSFMLPFSLLYSCTPSASSYPRTHSYSFFLFPFFMETCVYGTWVHGYMGTVFMGTLFWDTWIHEYMGTRVYAYMLIWCHGLLFKWIHWYMVHCTWYMVRGTWYMVHGT